VVEVLISRGVVACEEDERLALHAHRTMGVRAPQAALPSDVRRAAFRAIAPGAYKESGAELG
jgi:hypothetical protein